MRIKARKASSPQVTDGSGSSSATLGQLRRLSTIVPLISCGLCGGLLRDATTVIECLHSFCRECIVKKFKHDNLNTCPKCKVHLGCAPLKMIRDDHSLQAIIRSIIFPAARPEQLVPTADSRDHGDDAGPRAGRDGGYARLPSKVGRKRKRHSNNSMDQTVKRSPPKEVSKPTQEEKSKHITYELTEEEQLAYSKAIFATKEQTLGQIGDVELTRENMECLIQPDGWLKDQIIDSYIYCLRDIKEIKSRDDGDVFLEKTVATSYLQQPQNPPRSIVESITKYLDHDMVFLPINVPNVHWYLAVLNSRRRTIQVLDSKGPKAIRNELDTTKQKIESILKGTAQGKALKDKWKDHNISMWPIVEVIGDQPQKDESSCGLFMLKYMELWTGQQLVSACTQDEMCLFRRKLVSLLLHSKLIKMQSNTSKEDKHVDAIVELEASRCENHGLIDRQDTTQGRKSTPSMLPPRPPRSGSVPSNEAQEPECEKDVLLYDLKHNSAMVYKRILDLEKINEVLVDQVEHARNLLEAEKSNSKTLTEQLGKAIGENTKLMTELKIRDEAVAKIKELHHMGLSGASFQRSQGCEDQAKKVHSISNRFQGTDASPREPLLEKRTKKSEVSDKNEVLTSLKHNITVSGKKVAEATQRSTGMNPRHRCFPNDLAEIQLTQEQKNYVKEIGFEFLTRIQPCVIPKELIFSLAYLVDCHDGVLQLGDKRIPIEPLIPKLLGVPKGNMEVGEDQDCSEALRQKFTEKGSGKKLENVKNDLKNLVKKDDKDKFCISYMILALGYYLAPNTTKQANRKFLGVLEDVKKISEFNWCSFTAKYLIRGVQDFQKGNTNFLIGCTHILPLIYFDFLHAPKKGIQQIPRINYVQERDLEQLPPLSISSNVLNYSETLYAEELSRNSTGEELLEERDEVKAKEAYDSLVWRTRRSSRCRRMPSPFVSRRQDDELQGRIQEHSSEVSQLQDQMDEATRMMQGIFNRTQVALDTAQLGTLSTVVGDQNLWSLRDYVFAFSCIPERIAAVPEKVNDAVTRERRQLLENILGCFPGHRSDLQPEISVGLDSQKQRTGAEEGHAPESPTHRHTGEAPDLEGATADGKGASMKP